MAERFSYRIRAVRDKIDIVEQKGKNT